MFLLCLLAKNSKAQLVPPPLPPREGNQASKIKPLGRLRQDNIKNSPAAAAEHVTRRSRRSGEATTGRTMVVVVVVDVFVVAAAAILRDDDDAIEDRATGAALTLGAALAPMPLRATPRKHAERVLLRAEAIILGNENGKDKVFGFF